MSHNKLEVTLETINGGNKFAILTGKSPIYPYENGKRSSEIPTGTKYNVILQGNRCSALSIKIDGEDLLSNLADDKIDEACVSLRFIAVKFTGCKITVYSIDNQMVMSATATGVELVNLK